MNNYALFLLMLSSCSGLFSMSGTEGHLSNDDIAERAAAAVSESSCISAGAADDFEQAPTIITDEYVDSVLKYLKTSYYYDENGTLTFKRCPQGFKTIIFSKNSDSQNTFNITFTASNRHNDFAINCSERIITSVGILPIIKTSEDAYKLVFVKNKLEELSDFGGHFKTDRGDMVKVFYESASKELFEESCCSILLDWKTLKNINQEPIYEGIKTRPPSHARLLLFLEGISVENLERVFSHNKKILSTILIYLTSKINSNIIEIENIVGQDQLLNKLKEYTDAFINFNNYNQRYLYFDQEEQNKKNIQNIIKSNQSNKDIGMVNKKFIEIKQLANKVSQLLPFLEKEEIFLSDFPQSKEDIPQGCTFFEHTAKKLFENIDNQIFFEKTLGLQIVNR